MNRFIDWLEEPISIPAKRGWIYMRRVIVGLGLFNGMCYWLKLFSGLALIAAILPAQNATTSFVTTRCAQYIPGALYIQFLGIGAVPACVAKGTSLKIVTIGTTATLEVDWARMPPPVPPALPLPVQALRMAKQTFPLNPAIHDSQTAIRFVLEKLPAPGTLIMIYFRSSRAWGDVVDAVEPSGVDTRVLVITLPTYRPLSYEDSILLVYWTLEP